MTRSNNNTAIKNASKYEDKTTNKALIMQALFVVC